MWLFGWVNNNFGSLVKNKSYSERFPRKYWHEIVNSQHTSNSLSWQSVFYIAENVRIQRMEPSTRTSSVQLIWLWSLEASTMETTVTERHMSATSNTLPATVTKLYIHSQSNWNILSDYLINTNRPFHHYGS